MVSDFGIGPWKKKNEEFVDSFEWVYFCRQVRINGDVTIVQRSYPNKWQVCAAKSCALGQFGQPDEISLHSALYQCLFGTSIVWGGGGYARAVLKEPNFFLLRTAPWDHQPPSTNRNQLPTAASRQLPTATNHQSPITNGRQPLVANRQPPMATNQG